MIAGGDQGIARKMNKKTKRSGNDDVWRHDHDVHVELKLSPWNASTFSLSITYGVRKKRHQQIQTCKCGHDASLETEAE